MKTVYESTLGVDAHMVLNLLQSSGIEGQVLGDYLPGATGDLPAGLVRVVVADDDAIAARGVIAEWERRQPAPASPPAPRQRHISALAAFIAGAICSGLIVWSVLRRPVMVDHVDYDGDGVVDMRTQYAGITPVKSWFDRNADGKDDGVIDYDRHGQVEHILQDDDFDGRSESSWHYAKDVPTMTEHDRKVPGFVDTRCRYRFGVLAVCEYVDDVTGRVVKRDTYTGGFITTVELDTERDGSFDRKRQLDWMGEAIAGR